MTPKLLTKLVRLSHNLIYAPQGKHRHFTYIVRKNEIVSVGFNHMRKTDPLTQKHGYEYPYIHAELMAIRNFPLPLSQLKRHTIVNIRIGRDNRLRMAKPCGTCSEMLSAFCPKEIWYTQDDLFVSNEGEKLCLNQ